MAKKAAKKAAASKTGPTAVVKGKAREEDIVLPGMEDLEHPILSKCCTALAQIRRDLAELRADEEAQLQQALKTMTAEKRSTFTYAGYVLMRVPGHDSINVRKAPKADAGKQKP